MATWSSLTLEWLNLEFNQITPEHSQFVEHLNIHLQKFFKDKDMEELSIGGLLDAAFMNWYIKFLLSTLMIEAKCLIEFWMKNQFLMKLSALIWLHLSKDYSRKIQKKEWNSSRISKATNSFQNLILEKF